MGANFLSFLAPPAEIVRCNSLAALLHFNHRSEHPWSFTRVNNHVELFRISGHEIWQVHVVSNICRGRERLLQESHDLLNCLPSWFGFWQFLRSRFARLAFTWHRWNPLSHCFEEN